MFAIVPVSADECLRRYWNIADYVKKKKSSSSAFLLPKLDKQYERAIQRSEQVNIVPFYGYTTLSTQQYFIVFYPFRNAFELILV